MDYKEFNLAVDKFSDSLYTFLLKLTKNKQDAEDILQESFKKLWQNRKKVQFQKAKSFLFTVAYHKFIDLKRKLSHLSDLDSFEILENSYTMSQPDLSDIINKAVERLPEKQKAVVLLRDYEGYSYKEIAQITGLSEAQVKVYIFRARKSIREFIGSLENVL